MATKEMWLYGGQFHCHAHNVGIPFYFAPEDAECAECSDNSKLSFLVHKAEAPHAH